MVGLPRSGKSTKSKQLGFPVVEPDAIRMAIHGSPFKANMEPLVWAHARIMVEALFGAGHDDVVLDATNHTQERRSLWECDEWAVKYHVVDTPVLECIARAHATGQERLVPIIERMHRDFENLGGNLDG
jgi:predicted kinase